MTEKVDFTNYLEEKQDTVDIAEVEDISEVANAYLKVESEILNLENDTKNKKKELQQRLIGGERDIPKSTAALHEP